MSSTGPEANRFAPPVAHVEDVESAASGQLAGRGIRLVAAIVDGLIVGLAILLVALVTPYNAFDPREDALWFGFVLNLVLGFGAYLLLNGWLLHSRGQDHRQGAAEDPHRPQRRLARRRSGRIVGLRYLTTSVARVRFRWSERSTACLDVPAHLPRIATLPARQHRRTRSSSPPQVSLRPVPPALTCRRRRPPPRSRGSTRATAAETPEGIALRCGGRRGAALRCLGRSTCRSGRAADGVSIALGAARHASAAGCRMILLFVARVALSGAVRAAAPAAATPGKRTSG